MTSVGYRRCETTLWLALLQELNLRGVGSLSVCTANQIHGGFGLKGL